jgi:uncharacterized protein (TIGR02145 family)
MKNLNTFNESMKSSSIVIGRSSFKDSRDGREYQTVILDNGREKVEWFAENLDYDDTEDFGGKSALDIFFTNNDLPSISEDSSRSVCGRYYRFNSLNNACPEGWEIPKRSEFIDLFKTLTGLPPHTWRDPERRLITESLCGIGSILELHDCGRYEKPANYWFGTSSFAGHKPNSTDFQFSGNKDGYYWTSTPGSLNNGGSVFIFKKDERTYLEEVGYGYYTVRPIRKNI